VFVPFLVKKDSEEGERGGGNVDRGEKGGEGRETDRTRGREKVGYRIFIHIAKGARGDLVQGKVKLVPGPAAGW
jgi:hypothetical protein